MRVLTPSPSLVDQVVEAISDEIVTGVLPSGSRLIQDDLARAYGVSRQPIQQALTLLRGYGLVQSAPGRGLIVSPIDAGFVGDLYEIRAMLEGLAARLAAERASDRAASEGPAYIVAGRDAVKSGSVQRQIEADMAFHTFINQLSGNSLIEETTRPHWLYFRRVMAESLQKLEGMSTSVWDDHEAILAAVTRRDAKEAEQVSREHISRAAKKFVRYLQARDDVKPQQRRRLSSGKLLA